MITDLWINLPVKDVAKSKAFFKELGFRFNTRYGDMNNSASLIVGEKSVVVMLFDEKSFNGFTGSEVADITKSTEVLLSVGVDSKEAVDELAKKAVTAGGSSKHQPKEMEGWMYGCLFTDLDGHRWNVLYMDMTKMS
jgi:hypothetical protein